MISLRLSALSLNGASMPMGLEGSPLATWGARAASGRIGSTAGERAAGGGCTIKLEADGSFRLEDVEAGTYDLLIVVREPQQDPHGTVLGQNVLATARRELTVPTMPDGRSDEPLDLGAIPVTVAKKPSAAGRTP